MADAGTSREARLVLYGVAVGLAYGLLMRLLAHFYVTSKFVSVMSVSFIFITPFCMGFLTVFLIERKSRTHPWAWLGYSVLPLFGALFGAVAALLEGWICVLMFAPIGLVCSILGGLIGHISARYSKRLSVTCIVLLPLVTNPLEPRVLSRSEIRVVRTSIDIHATPQTVWSNIKTVPVISSGELPPSWTRKVGFPRPLEATLSYEGVGGVRHARFAGGVLFVETVDVWRPDRDLAFSIKAQTSQIPTTSLDPHVTIGGPFFDTLRGEYLLEWLPGGVIRLHLSSQERVSTDFNWYARLWTDAVMRDIQTSILKVIRKRCEAATVSMR